MPPPLPTTPTTPKIPTPTPPTTPSHAHEKVRGRASCALRTLSTLTTELLLLSLLPWTCLPLYYKYLKGYCNCLAHLSVNSSVQLLSSCLAVCSTFCLHLSLLIRRDNLTEMCTTKSLSFCVISPAPCMIILPYDLEIKKLALSISKHSHNPP